MVSACGDQEVPPELGVASEATIGPRGGSLVSDDGALVLNVPRGAVPQDIVVRIQRRALPTGPSVPKAFFWAELTATNARTGAQVKEFGVPVTVTLGLAPGLLSALRGTDSAVLLPEDLRWWQYDAASGRWLSQPATADPQTRTLVVRLTHFSYGAAGADANAQPAMPGAMQAYATDLFTGWPVLSYPFALPPGRAGLAPSLALNYFGGTVDTTHHIPSPPTTQAAWTGYGWDLSPGAVVRAADAANFNLRLGDLSSDLIAPAKTVGDCPGSTFEDNGPMVASTGTWTDWAYAGTSGGHARYSAQTGAKTTFNFTGACVTFVYARTTDAGKATVTIDGQFIEDLDTYGSDRLQRGRTYRVADGSHSISVKVSGNKNAASAGTYIYVDAFVASEPVTGSCTGVTTEDTAAGVSYTPGGGTWTDWSYPGTSGGHAHYASQTAAKTSFGFTGTCVTLLYVRASDAGIATVKLDGQTIDALDLYGTFALLQQKTYYAAPGSHTIEVSVSGSKNVGSTSTYLYVDAFLTTLPDDPSAAGAPGGRWHTDPERFARVEQLWHAVSIPNTSGGWTSASHASASGGAYKYSVNAGDTVTHTFSGTNVTWYTRTGSDQGRAKVFIDGVLMSDVDNYELSTVYQVPRTWSGLTNTSHTLVVSVVGVGGGGGTARVAIDAFETTGNRVEETSGGLTWRAGWLADYWLVTANEGTQYRFGFTLPDEVVNPPGTPPSGTRSTTGSLGWLLVQPTGSGTALERRGEQYLLDRITDRSGNYVSLEYDLIVADVSVSGYPTRGYARTSYLRKITYTLHASSPTSGERRIKIDRATRTISGTKDYLGDSEFDAMYGAGQALARQRFFSEDRISALRAEVCSSSCTNEANWVGAAMWVFGHGYLFTGFTGADRFRNRLLLTSVTSQDPGSSATLPATTYYYDTASSGMISRVTNGYGGEVLYAYQSYNVQDNPSYPYRRVSSLTTKSGITNGGAGSPEQFVTTYSYPSGSTLLGVTPGHPQVNASDALGTTNYEFSAYADGRLWWRSGLRGTRTRATYRNTDGSAARVEVHSWALRRSARVLDPDSGIETVPEIHAQELRATEVWSSEGTGKKVSRTVFGYDQFGNVSRQVGLGDISTSNDDRSISRTFVPNASGWVVGLANLEQVASASAGDQAEMTANGNSNANDKAIAACSTGYWQSFTAPATGVLKRVEPRLRPGTGGAPPKGTLHIEAYADNGSDAPGALLGRSSSGVSFIDAEGWFVEDLAADGDVITSRALRVGASQKIWVRLRLVKSGAGDVVWNGSTTTDSYAGGRARSDCAGTLPADFALIATIQPDVAPANVITEMLTSFDGQNFGLPPSQGLLTRSVRRAAQATSTQEVTLYEYDVYGNRTKATQLFSPGDNNPADARNPITTWTYDAAYKSFPVTDNVRAKDLGGGSFLTLTTTRDVDARSGRMNSVSDPNGALTSYAYDVFYRLLSVRRPGDASPAQATFTYDYYFTGAPNRLVVTAKDGSADSGLRTIEFFDGLGRLIEEKREVAENSGSVGKHSVLRRIYRDRGLVDKEYVAWGTPAQTSTDFLSKFESVETANPAQAYTTYTYDGATRVTRITNPDASYATNVYGDWVTTVADELGHYAKRYEDGHGRRSKVEEYVGGSLYATTSYSYDARDLSTQISDNASNLTQFTYDGLGRRTQLIDPDAGTITFTYDGLGRLSSQTDAKSQRLDWSYDLGSRQTLKTGTPPGGSVTTLATYTYDAGGAAANALGRRTSVSDSSGSTTRTYDSRGRVTQLAQVILGSSYSTAFSYDALDRITTMTYPDSEAVSTAYGANGLPISLSGTSTYLSAQTYDPLFRPLVRTFGSGMTATFDYFDTANELDHDGVAQAQDYRLKRVTYATSGGSVLQQHDYRYDRAGNLIRWWQQDQNAAVRTWSYTYDNLDRLTAASVANPPAGAASSFSYTYDQIGRISSGPVGTYSYGSSAHVHGATAAGSNSYSYDANGAATSRSESGTSYTHTYDLQGQQSSVTVSGTTTTFVTNADGDLVAKQVGGTTTANYSAGGKFEKNPQSGATNKYYGLGAAFVALRDGALHYLGHDHLGTTTLQTSASAAIEAAQFRAPYGQAWWSSGAIATDRQYTGQRSLESALGSIYHYGARWYSPVLGRFLSPDLIAVPEDPQRLDAYAYVRGNPLRLVDPTGLLLRESDGSGGGRCPSVSACRGDPMPEWKPTIHVTPPAQQRPQPLIFVPTRLGPTVIGDPLPAPLPPADPGFKPVDVDAGRRVLLNKVNPDNAGDAGESDKQGVVYERTREGGTKPYVGRAGPGRYEERKREKKRADPGAELKFRILGEAPRGEQLSRMEEYYIRTYGGPTNKSHPDGGLENKRHEMNDRRYEKAGGDF